MLFLTLVLWNVLKDMILALCFLMCLIEMVLLCWRVAMMFLWLIYWRSKTCSWLCVTLAAVVCAGWRVAMMFLWLIDWCSGVS